MKTRGNRQFAKPECFLTPAEEEKCHELRDIYKNCALNTKGTINI